MEGMKNRKRSEQGSLFHYPLAMQRERESKIRQLTDVPKCLEDYSHRIPKNFSNILNNYYFIVNKNL